jgi:hypothetical protein
VGKVVARAAEVAFPEVLREAAEALEAAASRAALWALAGGWVGFRVLVVIQA